MMGFKSLKQNELIHLTGHSARQVMRGALTYGKRVQWSLTRRGVIRDYLAASSPAKLQIGTGPNVLDGWLNTDYVPAAPGVVFLDATLPLPFEDRSLDYIFTEHLIEHLTYAQGRTLLSECHRVMRPGGRIRVATPNLLNIVLLYGSTGSEAMEDYIKWSLDFNKLPDAPSPPCFILNNFVRAWGHQFVYDPATLRAALECAGFEDVSLCEPGRSECREFQNLERHATLIGERNNAFETMVLEAAR